MPAVPTRWELITGRPGVVLLSLNAKEVLAALNIHEAKHRIGIFLSVNVRNAPVVFDDGDPFSLGFPIGHFLRGKLLSKRKEGKKENGENLFHTS